ncbi:hypothetical protein BOX15_Mlig005904g2 [Macrostomum lignano]|uniref:Dihydrolipoyllysine-residue succinyltransferase component of 2-oxoglutarate dehydrogenase complex, mitochondrial n=1 Tax=Macrostomum lignano TaxID=282301 RepID=A0A267F7G0_9PLAT|nr:hypothetical protein BOX15_Mlig005904g2 [Macrostomum lignano]
MLGHVIKTSQVASRQFLRVILTKNSHKCLCRSISSACNSTSNSHQASFLTSGKVVFMNHHSIPYYQWRQLHTSRSLRGGVVTGKVPAFAESVTEGDIRWEKQVGDTVAEDELVAEVETDKTSVQVHSPCAGVITELLVPDGQKVVAHQEVFKIEAGGAAPAAAKSDKKAAVEEKPAAPQQQPEQPKQPEQQAPAAPKEDKLVASQAPSKPPPLPQAAASSSASAPSTSTVGARSERRVKMSRMRLRIAERLKEAQNTCAMLTTFNEIDMSNVFEMRAKFQPAFEKQHGVKLGFMSPFVKAAAYALQQQAAVNAVIDGGDIVYRDYVDISVAVATPKGLVVPVLRGVHNMNLADIEHEIAALGVKARKNELAIEDMDGGTFTISNGGVFGSLFGTPIINPPQSAILGMHGVFDRPMAVNGKVEIRPMMFVALTYDHRLIDGREAVTFLRKIKSFVEDPRILLLGL